MKNALVLLLHTAQWCLICAHIHSTDIVNTVYYSHLTSLHDCHVGVIDDVESKGS